MNQPKDGQPTESSLDAPGKSDQRPSIDPLRRVVVPIERPMLDGHFRFRTQDKRQYVRDAKTGVIRRVR